MKRNLILVWVTALVLALGLSTASASVGAGATAAAKKGKGCKKGKAGKSAVGALAKKKGKGCAKGKGKAKGTALSDGTYKDAAQSLTLTVSKGTVALEYVPPGFCFSFNYTSDPAPLKKSGSAWTASEDKAFSLVGEAATVKWNLTVKEPGLGYALDFTLASNTMIGPCKGEGHPKGTLTKLG